MQRTNGRLLLVAGVLAHGGVLARRGRQRGYCRPHRLDRGVGEQLRRIDRVDRASSRASLATLPADTLEPTESTFALPGLVDPSDEPIANDDDVRTGTLDNGLQYYVRHNERPGRQGVAAVGDPRRFGRRDRDRTPASPTSSST